MISRTFSATVSVLALVAGSTVFAGCAADSSTSADDTEATMQSAEALSAESTATDPVEDAVVTDDDADGAAAEASEQDDAPAPLDIGCGFRMTLRERILKHFDKDGDGKLDHGEREALKDAIGAHPKLKLELVAIGVKARHHVMKRIEWAYDADNSGDLDASERAALAAAVKVRCEERKEHALAKFDANGDGKLDDGERAAAKAALKAHYMAKRDEVKAKFDANGDGKLDDGELAALKAAIRARFEKVAPTE
jgi:Ca2+-binding EF-hand superfamily protein